MRAKSMLLVGVVCSAVAVMFCSVSHAQGKNGSKDAKMNISVEKFGKTSEGEEVLAYTLTNASGMEARIITYGAIIQSLKTPDRDGKLADIVLGFDDLKDYLGAHPYFGAIVGRYGNRIAKGKFTIDGKEYTLAQNNGVNALHGGLKGFDKKVWKAEELTGDKAVGLKLSYTSPDGEEGYPGELRSSVTYWLTNDNELKMEYAAESSKPTPINLTNHSYFNLAGHDSGSIQGQLLMINADAFLPVDDTLIPTGERRPVAGTPFDFTKTKAIGKHINADDDQLKFYPCGFDHCFVLRKEGAEMSLCARAEDEKSGRVMEVFTTEPAVQFYTGNFLDATNVGKGGCVYYQRYGFCLETEHFPDSPNHPDFPNTILAPGKTYSTTTVYKFSVK